MSTSASTAIQSQAAEKKTTPRNFFALENSTAINCDNDWLGEISAATSKSVVRNAALACFLGFSDGMPLARNISTESLIASVESRAIATFAGFVAELRSWLESLGDSEFGPDVENEITSYATWQISNNFTHFSRAIKQLSLMPPNDLPDEAMAQLLISSADASNALQSTILGSSIESYLDTGCPLLVDAAAKSLSQSRLGYSHAAKRMMRVASRTEYKYLKKQLYRISEQLSGELHA